MRETIGFVGVGQMGSRMATNLLDADYDVAVFDVDQARVQAMEERGATGVSTISEIAERADVLFTSLPNADVVEEVYFGDGGVLESIDDGSMVVETSTIPPSYVESIAEAAADRDLAVVDCPVIGPPPDAEAATLTIVVGSSDAAYQRVEPILEHLGKTVEHVGEPGTAKRFKLANNVMTFGNFAVAAETFALVDRMGIDPEYFFETIKDGSGGSPIVTTKAPKAFEGDFEPGFTIEGARKDLRYAREMKESADFTAPVAAAVTEAYAMAAAAGQGERDYAVLIDVLRGLGR